MTAEGELLVMAPTFSFSGARNSEILGQLHKWAKADGRGLSFDSSTGYVLPNGARRSPDASWISKAAIQQLSTKNFYGFWHLCPAFVIELKSESDRLPVLRKKMQEWVANGAELGWLIDPHARSVEIYKANSDPRSLTEVESAIGEGPVAGFVLDLAPVWNPLN